MGQVNLTVSIDAKGNLQCPDISGYLTETITWVPDGTTVLSIQNITTNVGTLSPAPTSRNNWTGAIAAAGVLPGGGDGVVYTIVVNPVNSGSGQKQRSPKIVVNPPEEKRAGQKAETLETKS